MDFHHHGHQRRSTKTRNLKVARKKALVLEARLIEGTFGMSVRERMTRVGIPAAISQFMEYRETAGNRPGTLARYSSILSRFGNFATKVRLRYIDGLTVPLIDRYRNMRKPQISPHSIWQESRLLRDCLQIA